MKRGAAILTAAMVLTVGVAQGATQPPLGYTEAGHAFGLLLLARGLPVAKRLPDVKCSTYVMTRVSSTELRGRYYADDCKGNGFVVLVAAKKAGRVVTGWAGPTCRTSGPAKRAKGKVSPGCNLGSYPW